jgi:hypothetical protein
VPCWVSDASEPAMSAKLILFADANGSTVDSEPANCSIVVFDSPAAVFIWFITFTASDAGCDTTP